MESREQGDRHLHEQTGLSAGTVTDNDQLATDLSHLRDGLMGCDGKREKCARAQVMWQREERW